MSGFLYTGFGVIQNYSYLFKLTNQTNFSEVSIIALVFDSTIKLNFKLAYFQNDKNIKFILKDLIK